MKRRIINSLLAVCLAAGMAVSALPTTAFEAKAAVSASTVKAGLVIRESEINQLLTEDLNLPTEVTGVTGAEITYSVQEKDAKYVTLEDNSKLKITRPVAGEPDYKFTLKATITVPDDVEGAEDGKVEKEFPLTIRAGLSEDSYAGYVYVCFADKHLDYLPNSDRDGKWRDEQQIHFFLSEDGMKWTALNGCNPAFLAGEDYVVDYVEKYNENSLNYKIIADVELLENTVEGDASVLFPFEGNDQGVRDPYLIRGCRKDDSNKVWLLATDLNTMAEKYGGNRANNVVGNWGTMTTSPYGSTKLFVWETEDWVNWTRRYIDVDRMVDGVKEANVCMAWAPEAIYNPQKDNYLVYWSARTNVDGRTRDRLYCNETKDFITFGPTKLCEQEPFYINWKNKTPDKAHDGYGNIDTSQLWVADDTGNPYGMLYRLVKDETNNHIELMSAETVLAPEYEGNENQDAYDATDPKNITPFELGGKTYSALDDFNDLSDTRDLKRAEIVWNWFKNEAVGDHFEKISQTGIEKFSGAYEGATMFKFIDRDEWCVMIDNYGDMGVRYEPYLTTDLSEPNSIQKAKTGTYGRTGDDVGTHGGMIPITVKEYNTLIDTYNGDSDVENYHEIDYIYLDARPMDVLAEKLEAAIAGTEYSDSVKAQMRTLLQDVKALAQRTNLTDATQMNKLTAQADKLLKDKLVVEVPVPDPVYATGVNLSQTSMTLCTKATDGLKTNAVLTAQLNPATAVNTITWTSSNPSVAEVKNGTVTAKKKGTAVITATAAGGAKGTCTVTVKGIPSSKDIKLNKTKVTLKRKKTFQIKVTLPKDTVCKTFTYKTSKKKVATVSKKGKVTAKKKGTAKITVTAKNNSKAKKVLTVKVK